MLSLALICSGLIAALPEAPDPGLPTALETYEALQARIGRDASAHVELSLWCEARGLEAERVTHLTLAVLRDPKDARARGLLGLVAYRERWESPEKVRER